MSSIARRGLFRRILDAVESFIGVEPSRPEPVERPRAEPPPPPEPALPEYQPPSSIFVPPELSGIPPGAYERLSFYDKVLHSEGFVDYDVFDSTGEVIVTDQYAADLIYEGWFDPDASYADQLAARSEYFNYTGESERDFDWQTWRDFYDATHAHAA